MVAMDQWLGSEWTGRSLFRSVADAYTYTDANANPHSNTKWRITEQHARTAGNSNRRQQRRRLDSRS